MRKLIYMFAVCFCLATLSGCISRQERNALRKLHRLEHQLDSLPGWESGQPILDSLQAMDPATFKTKYLRAFHALLVTQARRKEKMPLNQDSLSKLTYNYFSKTADLLHKAKAGLYLSVACQSNGDITKAFYYAHEAFSNAKLCNEPLWIARAADQLSMLSWSRYYLSDAHEYTCIAAHNYGKTDFKINEQYCLIDLAGYYYSNNEPSKCEEILDSLISHPVDSSILFSALSTSINYLLDTSKYEKASEYMTRMDSFPQYFHRNAHDFINKGRIESRKGNNPIPFFENAKGLLNSVDAKAYYYVSFMNYYIKQNDHQQSFIYADSIISTYNNFLKAAFKDNTSLQKSKYMQATTDNLEKRFFETSHGIVTGILCLNILLTLFLIFVQRKLRRKSSTPSKSTTQVREISAKNIMLILKVTQFAQINQQLKEDNKSLSQSRQEIFQNQWIYLNQLCSQYLNNNNKIAKNNIYMQLEKQLTNLKQSSQQKKLFETADEYLNGAITLITQECPELQDEQINLFCLCAIGFTPKTISFFTDLTVDNIYKRRKRLCEKLEKINPPHLDTFLEMMAND